MLKDDRGWNLVAGRQAVDVFNNGRAGTMHKGREGCGGRSVYGSANDPNIFPLQSFGDADISGEELHDILKEIDTNMNGQVELDEYLQVTSHT